MKNILLLILLPFAVSTTILNAQTIQVGATFAMDFGIDHKSIGNYAFDDFTYSSVNLALPIYVKLPIKYGLNAYGIASFSVVKAGYYDVINPNGETSPYWGYVVTRPFNASAFSLVSPSYLYDYANVTIANNYFGGYLTKVVWSTFDPSNLKKGIMNYEIGTGVVYNQRKYEVDFATATDYYDWSSVSSSGNDVFYHEETRLNYNGAGSEVYIENSISIPIVNRFSVDWNRFNCHMDLNFFVGEDFFTTWTFGFGVNLSKYTENTDLKAL